MMSKYLILSVLAAWAFGAQAGESFEVSYTVGLAHIEATGKENAGTLPGSVTLKLIDTGFNDKLVYSTTVTFKDLEVSVGRGATVSLSDFCRASDGRFDIASFVKEHEEGSLDWPDETGIIKDASLSFQNNESSGGLGVKIEFTGILDSANVYENCAGKTPKEICAYVKDNLRTVFEVDGELYQMAVDAGNDPTSLNSLNDMGKLKPITPVPEPTSGLLLMMGLAGLALKRKQAK